MDIISHKNLKEEEKELKKKLRLLILFSRTTKNSATSLEKSNICSSFFSNGSKDFHFDLDAMSGC